MKLLKFLITIKINIIHCPKNVFTIPSRHLSKTKAALNFHEDDRKSGYGRPLKVSPRTILKTGLKMIPEEIKKFKDETISNLRVDEINDLYHLDYETIWKFDSEDAVNSWVVTADSDHSEGYSRANFVLNQNKKGLFYGNLKTDVPKDGILKSAGYCNIRSPQNMISFKRIRPYDLSVYTHFLIKLRGDGRTYQIVCNMLREWDIQWNDQFTYLLFTRGGPYWQYAKIPFSKFFLSSKGRVQDKQEQMDRDKISTIGISLGDSNPGPFGLELDFISVLYDESHKTNFEYEMYEIEPYMIS